MPFKRMNVTNLKWNDLHFNWKYHTYYTNTQANILIFPNSAEDYNDITAFDINTLCSRQFVSSSFFFVLFATLVVVVFRVPTILYTFQTITQPTCIILTQFVLERKWYSLVLSTPVNGLSVENRKYMYEIVLHRPLLIISIEFAIWLSHGNHGLHINYHDSYLVI